MEMLAWGNKKAGDPAGKNIWKSLGLYCENLELDGNYILWKDFGTGQDPARNWLVFIVF